MSTDTETPTTDQAAATAALAAYVDEAHEADDGRWFDIVIDLVDDLAHHNAAEAANTTAVDRDMGELHDEADLLRSELANGAPGPVAEYLATHLTAEGALEELHRREGRNG